MVSRLDERLAAQGGTAEEWGRLMSSYAALDRPQEAMRAFEASMIAYPDGEANAALQAHAVRLGLMAAPTVGPSQEDVEAAQQMTPEDRQAMIAGMVQRLEDRLTSDGGTAEDWLRLIRSYVQLDRKDDAARVYRLAEVALADDPSRGFVKTEALLMGLPVE